MKRFFVALMAFMVLTPSAFALNAYSQATSAFEKFQTNFINPITITATEDNEITAANGINIIILPSAQFIWHKVNTINSSNGFQTGLVAQSIPVTYTTPAYRILRVPVLRDFAAGESITINGMMIRAFQFPQGAIGFGFDVNGDDTPDFYSQNAVQIGSELRASNTVAPYPVSSFTYTVSDDKTQVTLNWTAPPDLDVVTYDLYRKKLNNGGLQTSPIVNKSLLTYTDTVDPTDIIEYTVRGRDEFNLGETTTITVNVGGEAAVPETPSTPVTTEEQELTSRFDYYKLRYAIQCLGETEGASCLWTKVDFAYAVERLNRTSENIALSARDRELLGYRLPWIQKRFQTSCIDVTEPANFCTALGKVIDRVDYFLNQ